MTTQLIHVDFTLLSSFLLGYLSISSFSCHFDSFPFIYTEIFSAETEPPETRTRNLLIKSQLLYQLS